MENYVLLALNFDENYALFNLDILIKVYVIMELVFIFGDGMR
jgi:hypothetical protein